MNLLALVAVLYRCRRMLRDHNQVALEIQAGKDSHPLVINRIRSNERIQWLFLLEEKHT